jgi:uncharacterized protein YabN with tetrapyrrole methylase and pyrophosphatase domain
LLYALKVQKRAGFEGFDWRDLAADGEGNGAGEVDAEIGERLLALVDEAARAGVDPESALRLAAERIRDRCRARELASGG